MVNRALSFAASDPQGPVYLYEACEPFRTRTEGAVHLESDWKPVAQAALLEDAVRRIAETLMTAEEDLVITGYSGRNHSTVAELIRLPDTVKGLTVL